MAVSGEECATDIHTAGGYPYIVYRNFSSFFAEMEINERIFSGHILVDIDNAYLQFRDNFLKFFFVVLLSRPFHKTVRQFSDDDGWQIEFVAKFCKNIHDCWNAFSKITINVGI